MQFAIDLFAVRSGVVPGAGEVLGSERGVCAEELSVCASCAAVTLQKPYRQASPNDPSRALAGSLPNIYAGVGVCDL